MDKEQLGESIKLAAALGSVNWFYWVLLGPAPLLLWFPVSINTPEEQHHILILNMEMSVISQKSLCIDLPPSAFGFFSFYPLLGSFPDLQKSRTLKDKHSVAVLPYRKEHFLNFEHFFIIQQLFPIPPPLPFPKEIEFGLHSALQVLGH